MRLKLALSCLGKVVARYVPTNVRAHGDYFGAKLRLWDLALGPCYRPGFSACCPSFAVVSSWHWAALVWDSMHDEFERPEAQFVTGNTTHHARFNPAHEIPPIKIPPLDLSIAAPGFHLLRRPLTYSFGCARQGKEIAVCVGPRPTTLIAQIIEGTRYQPYRPPRWIFQTSRYSSSFLMQGQLRGWCT